MRGLDMQDQSVKDTVLIAPLDSFADRFPAPFPGGVTALRHGSLTAELWKAEGYDEMFWHDHPQDELYVIVSGNAAFVSEDGEYPSRKAGDVVFCPARLKHNFKDFSDDFVVWIFVYGPMGGEAKGRQR
jgi:mannose-6-phosphate isomerase-like protein (cupin superfamily)